MADILQDRLRRAAADGNLAKTVVLVPEGEPVAIVREVHASGGLGQLGAVEFIQATNPERRSRDVLGCQVGKPPAVR